MPTRERKERERADRHRRILDAARELAEDQGWDAVTTRRLADRIEFSQPVLYGHFPGGKDEIVAGVALEGFADLATTLRAAVDGTGPGGAPEAVITAYLDFAAAHPAVYTAMFESAALPFGREDTPAPLHEGFSVLRDVLAPAAADPGRYAELAWATLHGLATLTRAGRLPPDGTADRRALAVDLLAPQTP